MQYSGGDEVGVASGFLGGMLSAVGQTYDATVLVVPIEKHFRFGQALDAGLHVHEPRFKAEMFGYEPLSHHLQVCGAYHSRSHIQIRTAHTKRLFTPYEFMIQLSSEVRLVF